jgi:methionine synthase I (cobalamin-dependent)
MSYARLKRRLDAGDVLLLDGPTGTELQRRGAAMDPAAWCGPATLQHDRLLTEIHADYIAAGAAVVTANTYASSRLMLTGAGLADRVDRRAVAAALRARDAAPHGAEVVVAGSLSHMVPVSAGTADVDLRLVPSDAAVADALGELAGILKSAGAELILLEMMYHPGRTRLALAAALETGLPVWFGLSARRAADGRLVAFHHAADLPLDDIAGLIPAAGIDAAGVMHTNAALVDGALAVVRRYFAGPLMAYPDSGYFESPDWRFVDSMSPARFEEFCRGWISCGVQLIGGCCGLSVEHIRAAARARDEVRPLSRR